MPEMVIKIGHMYATYTRKIPGIKALPGGPAYKGLTEIDHNTLTIEREALEQIATDSGLYPYLFTRASKGNRPGLFAYSPVARYVTDDMVSRFEQAEQTLAPAGLLGEKLHTFEHAVIAWFVYWLRKTRQDFGEKAGMTATSGRQAIQQPKTIAPYSTRKRGPARKEDIMDKQDIG